MHAEGPRLPAGDAAGDAGEVLVVRRAQRHRGRQHCRAAHLEHVGKRVDPAHAEAGAGLEVGRHEERDPGVRLQPVEAPRVSQRGPERHHDPADPVVAREGFDAAELLVAGRRVAAAQPHHDELRHSVAQAEAGERLLDPVPRDAVLRDAVRAGGGVRVGRAGSGGAAEGGDRDRGAGRQPQRERRKRGRRLSGAAFRP